MKKTFVIVAATASVLLAQEKAPEAGTVELLHRIEAARGVTRAAQTVQFLSGINVGPTVAGAPYSAEAITESVQKLYDGNRIVQKSSTKQYRDSEGRERREEGAPMNAVFITDPVAKVSYTLYPDTQTASKTNGTGTFFFQHSDAQPTTAAVRAPISAGTLPAGGRGNIIVASRGVAYASAVAAPNLTVTLGPEPGTAKIEDLGTQTIEGVQAKGTRATTIIPTGQIGNDREIEVVDERWYSPELQLTIMTRHTDPRVGENTYKLTNIQRIEQVRSLFEVPPNYTIATDVFRVAPGAAVPYTQGFPSPMPAPAKKEE